MSSPKHMYTMLLVDDDPGNVNFLRLAFRDDYLVLTAYDGLKALELLVTDEHREIALIITDEKMPQKTGRKILEESMETHPNTIRWLITAYPETEDSIYDMNEIYVDRYIRKPIRDKIAELKEDIKNAIKLFELRRQNLNLREELVRSDDERYKLMELGSSFIPKHLIRQCATYALKRLKEEVIEKDVTVLYANMQNFIDFSEHFKHHELFLFLNGYLKDLSDVIAKNHGMVVQNNRDTILAVFGITDSRQTDILKDAQDAVKCAAGMKDAIARFNQRTKEKNIRMPEIRFGIGINSGKVAVGCLGSDLFLKYTVIGNVVTTAIWLQGLMESKETEIIISEESYNRAKDMIGSNYKQFSVEESLKGRKGVSGVYLITGIEC